MIDIRTKIDAILSYFLPYYPYYFYLVVAKLTIPNPLSIFFEADFTTITEGDSVTLNWKVTEATSVTIDPDIGLVDLSGSISVSPVSTTAYT